MLKEREASIRAQLEREGLGAAKKDQLEISLATVLDERADLERELEEVRASLGELAQRIEEIQEVDELLPLREIEKASSERAAEAAFQQGVLAEQSARRDDAMEHYRRATRFAPENPKYQGAVERMVVEPPVAPGCHQYGEFLSRQECIDYDRIINELKIGELAFNKPERMTYGVTETVALAVALTPKQKPATEALAPDLTGQV